MDPNSFLSLACAGIIGILFGLTLCFAGYRFFLFLLPVFGLVFGIAFGAQTIQALFGEGFLATVTSWAVGLVTGVGFAVLSYFFYIFAVALIAGSIGYGVTYALLTGLGLNTPLLIWVIAVVAAIALAVVTIRFNIAKWVIIVATSLWGAGVAVGTVMLMFNPMATVLANPLRALLSTSPLLTILAVVLAAVGIVVQARQNRNFSVEGYNRWSVSEY
jgi:hypothetical protein